MNYIKHIIPKRLRSYLKQKNLERRFNTNVGLFTHFSNVDLDTECVFGQSCIVESSEIGRHVSVGNRVGIFSSGLGNNSIVEDDSRIYQSVIGSHVKLYYGVKFGESEIGDYSYMSNNGRISKTVIGKFCSIGPDLSSGHGIHPIGGISTSPMFYSTLRQNGTTLSATDKIEERRKITIGNDVFIGMNVCILDGVNIGHGAVIGAGSVVVKDVPSYAVVGGVPAKVIKYRFDQAKIDKLLAIKWWDWDVEKLMHVEQNFFDIDTFLKLFGKDSA